MAASNEFERQRQQLIARNRERLQQLGLLDAKEALDTSVTKPKPKRKPRAKRVVQAPTRHSKRQEGQGPEQLNDEEAQLAKMYVDGECPKCGKALEKGLKQHFERCTGPPAHKRQRRLSAAQEADLIPENDEYEEDELVEDEGDDSQKVTALPKQSKAKMAAKLKQLELSGLVDFTPEHAKFAVLGSTGKRYTVTLEEARRACQCPDFRIRKRDCKHIKLVLQQLGIGGEPDGWRQAVEKQLDQAQAVENSGGGSDAGAFDGAKSGDGSGGETANDEVGSEKEGSEKKLSARKRGSKAAAAATPPKRPKRAAAGKQRTGSGGGGEGAEEQHSGGRTLPASLRR